MPSFDLGPTIEYLRQRRDEITLVIEGLESLQADEHAQVMPVRQSDPSGRFAGLTRREAAYRVLKERGVKMTVRDIVEELTKGGFKSEARKPIDSMRAAMRRDKRITRLEPFGAWGLQEWEGRFIAEDGTPREPVAMAK
ncbi:MAG: winged helix-turn-helix domain-containing protein [Chloroflexi bacterium]|nr:winged helix-turn-helix domain-containing protein [Chloroflexota bacterium]